MHASGKGRHRLELAVRLRLSRQGGWRVAEGLLPTAPAAALEILVPKARTELRLGQVADRRQWETEKPDETIRTALGADGSVGIRWRPEVAQGETDRSLTVASAAVLDVQEDGLRLWWQLGLEFRRAEREQFSVDLPAGYLLEKVEGNNVRGWEIRKTPRGQAVEVTLLQAAKDREQFTLRLWRGGGVGGVPTARAGEMPALQSAPQEFDVPLVTVPEAALHRGELVIRRSPLLELRTLEHSGVTRIDLPGGANSPADEAGGAANPLGIRPFEAYRFAAVPFSVRLKATPATAHVSATVQTVLRLAEYEREMESRVLLDVQGRRVYRLQMFLPAQFRLEHVSAPGEFQYAVTQQAGRALLTIYLAAGQAGDVPVVLRGKLGQAEKGEVPLPRLEVLGVDRQQGDVAVEVDPAFDVEARGLAHCEPVLLGQVFGWLTPAQRPLARLALHYTGGDYSGGLRLQARTADVSCDAVSNVRVTDRTLEETILLDFTIRHAGIRRLSLLLPAWMADARWSVPMLRQKTVEPVSETGVPPAAKQAAPGSLVRVRIELQDEVMGQLRVLVENDQLLTPGSHEAPIPVIELGRINRRYVVIERTGRDEVVPEQDKLREIDVLGRRQKEWETLTGILGHEMTMAYLVSPDARQPRLSFHTEAHTAVATVKASIGLAETTLVLDAAGAYRAQAVLRVNNATEQFLEIRLPAGAELWAVRVAGEPVKPTKVPGKADPRAVRIPLLKTAPGDLYYEVVLKYGGQMPPLSALGSVEFPLLRCVNIQPDLSQVKLYVPEQYRWFDFGGTMRRVEEEADLQAGVVQFMNKQLSQIGLALQQGDDYAKARAVNNLKQLGLALHNYGQANRVFPPGQVPASSSNPDLQSALTANAGIMQQVQQEAAVQEQAPQKAEAQFNRGRLNDAYQSQSYQMARNVVGDVGANWSESGKEDKDRKEAVFTVAKPQWQTKKQPSAAQVVNPQIDIRGLYAPSRRQTTTTTNEPQQALRGEAGGLEQRYYDESNESLNRYKQQLAQQSVQAPGPGGIGGAYADGRLPNVPTFGPRGPTQQQPLLQGAGGQFSGEIPAPAAAEPPVTRAAPSQFNRIAGPGEMPGEEKMTGRLQFGVGVNSDAGLVGRVVLDEQNFAPATAGPAAPPPATGLASLDVDLPERGTLLRFTAPGGDATITGRNVSNDLLRRLIDVGIVAAVLLAAWIVVGLVRRIRGHRRGAVVDGLARPLESWLLIAVGVLMLLGGVLPVAGLAAILAGCGLKLHRWRHA